MKLFFYRSSIILILLLNSALSAEKSTSTITNGLNIIYGFWSKVISPVDGPRCPYYPTCAGYARIAVNRYGLVKGTMIASERLQRCNGWHDISHYEIRDGRLYDPVENNLY